MTVITTIAGVFGAVIGAAFLLAGGILLPLWEQHESRTGKNEGRA